MLTNPYLIALGIPILLILCGAMAKKIARGGGWKQADFFLGVELTLSALGSAMVYFFELQQPDKLSVTAPILSNKITATASFLVINFFLLFWILSTHQDWENRSQSPIGQIVWLGIISNALGIGLFAAFIIIVKGV